MQQTSTQQSGYSSPAYHEASTMQLIIDSRDIIEKLERYLKGEFLETVYNEETKKAETVIINCGEAKANSKGIQFIKSWVEQRINPLISFSNIAESEYSIDLCSERRALAKNLMLNRHNYGVKLAYFQELMNNVFNPYKTFLTSAIKGGHRNVVLRGTEHKVVEQIERDRSPLKIFS